MCLDKTDWENIRRLYSVTGVLKSVAIIDAQISGVVAVISVCLELWIQFYSKDHLE